LATRLGISTTYLSDIELGNRTPSCDRLLGGIAKELGLELDYLYYLAGVFPPGERGRYGAEEFRKRMTSFRGQNNDPPTKDKNPTPGEEFRFQLSGGRTWATDGKMVLSEGLWGRIEPIKHWRILSADEIALVESKIGAWKSGTPVHPGEFDPCFAPVIGNGLIWGLGVNEPGYLLDYCDDTDKWFVVGLLMPIGRSQEKNSTENLPVFLACDD
jgi:transcriptional regulator with XRE-family HTH domain